MTNPQRNLTFGIEYEFLLASVPVSEPDPSPYPDGRRIHFERSSIIPNYRDVYESQSKDPTEDFAQHGHVAEMVAQNPSRQRHPRVSLFRKEGSAYPASERDLTGWKVKMDPSVIVCSAYGSDNPLWNWEEQVPDDTYEYYGIEVISSVLRQRFTRNPIVDDRHLRQAEEVANILQTNFRIFGNKTCGLHVHVGDDKNGFPFATMQKLVGFLWAFEPGIEKLHPIRRRHPEITDFCKPLRSGIFKRFPSMSSLKILNALIAQSSISALSAFMHGNAQHRWRAYNLRNLI